MDQIKKLRDHHLFCECSLRLAVVGYKTSVGCTVEKKSRDIEQTGP